MSEDDGDKRSDRGKSFPGSGSSTPENVVPFVRGKSFSVQRTSKSQVRTTDPFRSPEEIEYLRLIFESYMQSENLTPQKLYDRIMAPEIDAEISRSKREDGITLSRVQARPDQDGKGRDIVRNWITRYPFSVSKEFLKYAYRFAEQNRLMQEISEISRETAKARVEYHIQALKSIFADVEFSPVPLEEFRFDGQVTFAMLSGRREPVALLSIWFNDDLTGHFAIIMPNQTLPLEHFRKALASRLPIDAADMLLAARGYVIPHRIHEPPKHAKYEVVFSALFVETFETNLPDGTFLRGGRKHNVPFQYPLTVRCNPDERRDGGPAILIPVEQDSMDDTIPEEFSFLATGSSGMRLALITHKSMDSMEKFAIFEKNA